MKPIIKISLDRKKEIYEMLRAKSKLLIRIHVVNMGHHLTSKQIEQISNEFNYLIDEKLDEIEIKLYRQRLRRAGKK